ncbi:MAG: microcin ABC transporter ATP-binding protein [Alphaproteobacteria bacterium]|nr:MAG: microcin ABC transporter ATP-binding protein [Alphaproteobacteria bacterium]
MSEKILQIKNLHVDFKTPSGDFHAVKGVSFDIAKGETMALVGESGSGKSVTALSAMKLLPYPVASHRVGSSIIFEGEELIDKGEAYMRGIRGQQIGMIFQEPQSALNPLHTIEKQIGEVLRIHQGMDRDATKARVLELLDMVGLSKMKQRLNAYPHELSGGQRQRVMIAMALANKPELLIADEPTTALDVTVQAQVLELLKDLQKELNMAMLLITHDLSVVERMADHVCVMRHGEFMESSETKTLFSTPKHDYTKMLLNTRPHGTVKAIKDDAPTILSGNDIKVHFPHKRNFMGKTTDWIKAVDGIDITIKRGETLGVVGESGSGKSTLGLAALRLLESQGALRFDGQEISNLNRKAMRPLRSRMQIVFQDPYGSLSPRMSVAQIIGEGLKLHQPDLSDAQRGNLIVQALEDVQMSPDTRDRYPHEFSGGQRQRISIARAMVLAPEFVVLDEPTSALDVSVQAEIVDLLRGLQEKHSLSYMFISHDLRVVRAMSHNVLVMKDGKVIEHGSAEDIFNTPKEDYTKTLLDAAMNLKVT